MKGLCESGLCGARWLLNTNRTKNQMLRILSTHTICNLRVLKMSTNLHCKVLTPSCPQDAFVARSEEMTPMLVLVVLCCLHFYSMFCTSAIQGVLNHGVVISCGQVFPPPSHKLAGYCLPFYRVVSTDPADPSEVALGLTAVIAYKVSTNL